MGGRGSFPAWQSNSTPPIAISVKMLLVRIPRARKYLRIKQFGLVQKRFGFVQSMAK